jgi:membrane associated rhomboid family serine protease
MTLAIIAFTVVVSLLAFKDRKVFENLLFAPFDMSMQKDWFRFLTHGFIHGNIPHLAINMFVLFTFGDNVERGYAEITGKSPTMPFLLLYLGGIALASLPGYYKHKNDPTYRAVGASGAISAVVFASILMFPNDRLMLLFFPVPTKAWVFGLLYLGYEWFMNKRGRDGIAHDAHFYGALFGIVFTLVLDPTAGQRLLDAIRS